MTKYISFHVPRNPNKHPYYAEAQFMQIYCQVHVSELAIEMSNVLNPFI